MLVFIDVRKRLRGQKSARNGMGELICERIHQFFSTKWEINRKKGLTIPTADLIIVAAAIENNSLILHHDEHYEMIAHHFPILQTKHFGL